MYSIGDAIVFAVKAYVLLHIIAIAFIAIIVIAVVILAAICEE